MAKRFWIGVMGVLTAIVGFVAGGRAQQDGTFTPGGPGEFEERGGAVSRIQAEIIPARLMPGGKATLKITVDVAKGYHINANKPGDASMIPTTLTFETPKAAGVTVGKIVYPAAKTMTMPGVPKPLKVYEGPNVFTVPITLDTTKIQPGTVSLKGTLRYQGCTATTCLPPKTAEINASFIVNGKK